MGKTELKCHRCGYENIISIYQPSWMDIDLVGKSPSSMYVETYKINDLLTVNALLGEQNVILKKQVLSLMESVKYFVDKTKKETVKPPKDEQ